MAKYLIIFAFSIAYIFLFDSRFAIASSVLLVFGVALCKKKTYFYRIVFFLAICHLIVTLIHSYYWRNINVYYLSQFVTYTSSLSLIINFRKKSQKYLIFAVYLSMLIYLYFIINVHTILYVRISSIVTWGLVFLGLFLSLLIFIIFLIEYKYRMLQTPTTFNKKLRK